IALARQVQAANDKYSMAAVWLVGDVWCRVIIGVLAGVALVRVAIHAAGSISSERAQRTLDCLLTTPLEPRKLLLTKWLGSLLSARGCWGWLFAVWGLSMFFGGGHWRILAVFLGAWLIYAACFAMVGIWFSLGCATVQKATLWTLITLVVLSGG